ncbi:hypothetical protein BDV38DRAFT_234255 [Aspergillus pseudotamarii]|uniref:RING-type domain-containing protein n=1 Tax=Aspergillus pseudotamarii TaxID=132259 RepID=A0A5N6T9E5_ASPPS|nr:uncharacterized protein BDV38DRAFT_234255 [Aspergillus pseudotamarii]KAE8142922.1 hypothetical protein BDV38DRAFT_234255 [Aspergillus pseudotamarii]
MAEYYVYMPSKTERGGLTKQELALAPMPCYFGSKDWTVSQPCALPKECELCLEQLGPESAYRILPCKHIFHLPCIDCWLYTEDASCPLCRRTFYEYRRPRTLCVLPPSPSSGDVWHRRRHASVGGVRSWVKKRFSTHS